MFQPQVFTYEWRHILKVPETGDTEVPSTIRMGDEVWVKPPYTRFTTEN